MPANKDHTFNDRFLTVFCCFLGNAMAIHFEDIMINIYGRFRGDKKKARWKTLLGYMWVTCWIWITCCWGATAYLKMGMSRSNEAQFPMAGKLIDMMEGKTALLGDIVASVANSTGYISEELTQRVFTMLETIT
jgi:hypothetical protein